MPENLRDVLGTRVVVLDGAIGTEFYSRGVFINRSYDELNLANPDLVQAVHADYVAAGAEILTTNTFGANRIRLTAFGLEDKAKDMVAAGVRLARRAAMERVWVGGSIGPTGARLAPLGQLSPGEAFSAFKEQAEVLAEEGVDLFILETFTNLPELWQAFRAARRVSPNTPILACLSFHYDLEGYRLQGPDPVEAARTITGWGADAVGVNCSNGPKVALDVLEAMAAVTDLPLAAQPNAGLPQEVDGRTLYMAGPEYMAEYARRFVQKGATLVGGCCGTSPATIREIRSFVRSVSPVARSEPVTAKEPTTSEKALAPVPAAERSPFAKKLLSGKFCVSVELDPPRGLDPERSLRGATYLKEQGIDVINIADGPRAIARMGPAALAQLAMARCEMESVIHFCCRDRNLLGMQMDLLGSYALGHHNILAVTGDPPKMGTYPNATAVFDIDAIGLLTFIQMLNRGLDFSGNSLDGQTSFFVGAGCNPGHVDLDYEVDRFHRKVAAGAEFFFSQPVYDPELLHNFLDRTQDASEVPFLVGILPLASHKNAEFLHNEVPGMQVPQAVRDRMAQAGSREDQRKVGITVARECLAEAAAHPRVSGTYIYPPFGSYKAVARILSVLEEFAHLQEADAV